MSKHTTTNKVDFNKPVQTKFGLPVRILCVDRKTSTDYPILGLVLDDDVENVETWCENGQYYNSNQSHKYDLVNVPKKHKRVVRIYKNTTSNYNTYKYSVGQECDIEEDYTPQWQYLCSVPFEFED